MLCHKDLVKISMSSQKSSTNKSSINPVWIWKFWPDLCNTTWGDNPTVTDCQLSVLPQDELPVGSMSVRSQLAALILPDNDVLPVDACKAQDPPIQDEDVKVLKINLTNIWNNAGANIGIFCLYGVYCPFLIQPSLYSYKKTTEKKLKISETVQPSFSIIKRSCLDLLTQPIENKVITHFQTIKTLWHFLTFRKKLRMSRQVMHIAEICQGLDNFWTLI